VACRHRGEKPFLTFYGGLGSFASSKKKKEKSANFRAERKRRAERVYAREPYSFNGGGEYYSQEGR